MQFVDATGHRFLSPAGRGEFTAPELANVDLAVTVREKSSDLFGLAVNIYLLLMGGKHLFKDGVWTGEGAQPDPLTLAASGNWSGGPASRFAAEFVGNANLVEGVVVAEHPSAYHTIRLADGLELRGRPAWADRHAAPDGNVLLCIRPETLQIVPPNTEGDNVFPARVTRVSYLGASLNCELLAGSTTLRVDLPVRSGLSEGAAIWVRIDPDSVVIVPGED